MPTIEEEFDQLVEQTKAKGHVVFIATFPESSYKELCNSSAIKVLTNTDASLLTRIRALKKHHGNKDD